MTYDIICADCDTEYEIIDDDDLELEPCYCPYCGIKYEQPTESDEDVDL